MATLTVDVLICTGVSGQSAGFRGMDDLGVGGLAGPPAGCRTALAGEITVRITGTTPDGLPVVAQASTDGSGRVTLMVPVGGVPLRAVVSAEGGGRTSLNRVTLRPTVPAALALVVSAETGPVAVAGSVSSPPDAVKVLRKSGLFATTAILMLAAVCVAAIRRRSLRPIQVSIRSANRATITEPDRIVRP